MNDFTFEEQQLMSIYNPGTRLGLIRTLVEMRTYNPLFFQPEILR